ncbi:MAG: beta-galactosidase trimerization domain-containing protein [Chloroflexi bacterium]|nr:beta-galactosidase trimerization domain-containing protein [Chloroflexota bacterium]
MTDFPMRFRQIHLDFHTSEAITGIGSKFDPDEFADRLEQARVNSITCFARGHHGWIYYDSAAHPERMHPHLARNLLVEQIEACHARGIRVPVYTTVQWDHLTATQNPEWLCINEDGRYHGNGMYEAGFYRRLALNSPYMDFLKAHVADVFACLPAVDGFFFDIVHAVDDSSSWTTRAMLEAGLDPADPAARLDYGGTVLDAFRSEMTAHVRGFSEDCTIFYNRGHVGPHNRRNASAFTHWELESLPSGHWGYIHFPLTMRYARTLDLPCLGHTGKFHTAWGDFHSFKNQEALEYECFRMIAMGCGAFVGDQLPPDGKIEEHVYELIGNVYRQIEAKEPWCIGARALSDIAVMTPEEFAPVDDRGMQPSICGAHSMLQEAGHQFDIVDSQADFSDYMVLILPDDIPADAALNDKINDYLAGGGALITSFESGLNADKSAFALDALPAALNSEGPRDRFGELVRGRQYERGDYTEYIIPAGAIGKDLPPTEHAMYIRGLDLNAAEAADVRAHITPAVFDRTYEHFCSHRQSPSSGESAGAAIIRRGPVITFSSPIFTQYYHNAPRWCRTLFLNALDLLLPQPLVKHGGPSTLEVTLNEQPAQNRLVLHLLHYIPIRRSRQIDIIEDIIPIYDIPVSICADNSIKSVKLSPSGASLDFNTSDGRIHFNVPVVNGHQMVELNYRED